MIYKNAEGFLKARIPANLDDEFQKQFNELAVSLYNAQTLLEFCHRETKSGPRHEALADAYEDLAEAKDDIIEFISGDSGKKQGVITSFQTPEYSDTLPMTASEVVLKLSYELKKFADKYDIPSVDSRADDVHAIGAKLRYKLLMDDSDEKNDKLEKGYGSKRYCKTDKGWKIIN